MAAKFAPRFVASSNGVVQSKSKTSFNIRKAEEHYALHGDASEALNILGYRTNGLEKLLFKIIIGFS